VRTIDSDGKQLGVLTISQALAAAQARGMDLIEVAPNATPPVCRITDFGKYKYEQTKREREARKHQHAGKLKEIKLRLNIDPHDYATKINHMREFLAEGMKVKVSVFFRGRENAHPELGDKLMQKVIVDLQGAGRAEVMPKLMGRSIHMLLGPVRGAAKKVQQAGKDDEEESK
jgi:translation initiation factor IF-3